MSTENYPETKERLSLSAYDTSSSTQHQSDLENNRIETYDGANDEEIDSEVEDEEPQGHPISRQQSILQRVQTSMSFFNEKLSQKRHRLTYKFGLIYFLMAFFVLGIFSIYWGSMYNRFDRLRNLRMLVVIEDEEVNGISPYIGDEIRAILRDPIAKYHGDWIVFNSSEFQAVADRHNNSIEAEIQRQIHHQRYWASLYVKPNATYNLYQALLTGDTTYNVTNNSVISIYETGRDFLNMNSYVIPSVETIEEMWLDTQAPVMLQIAEQLPNRTEVLAHPGSLSILASPISLAFFDLRPYTDPVLVAPSQVGLIYMIIVTFFQFNFFADIHQEVAKFGLKKNHYILYRFIASVISFFVLSLFYSLVTLAFQVDFTKAFGKSGFLVYWMISFLTMWAVGSANEIMGMLLIAFYPPMLGFWMLFWVIVNITPTFTPLALSAKFFRYGYGLPIHASYELTKVVFFDTYKGAMGRNFGILIAWIVILTAILPFVVVFFGKTMAKKAKAAAAAQAAAKAAAEEKK
ncbi:hypothetical protein G9P44_000202 [Scheffersomyces stipitis]|nr:hypothetical protein G9P44_000202 [Scheffersomyces stipitis]